MKFLARKHLVDYYNTVAEQWVVLKADLADFEQECREGIIEPEKLEQIKENIQPLLNNYETLSYIMFLLNKPAKKEKEKRYVQQNKKFLKSIDPKFTKEGLIEENKNVLNTYRR